MRVRKSQFRAILLFLGTLALVACSGADATLEPTLTPTLEPNLTPVPTPESTLTPSEVTEGELTVGLIATDLSVGPNRLAFFLLDSESGPVKADEAEAAFFSPPVSEGSEAYEVKTARFRPWPLGGLGVYTTRVSFDRAGTWGLLVSITGQDGSTRSTRNVLEVKESSATPAVGSPAPSSKNKTSRDVSELKELTTAQEPDPELYEFTIAEALANDAPFVVVFATPALCQSATCGPQVDVLEGIKEKYKDSSAVFIHVEIIDNPNEALGDLSAARTAPVVDEWGLPSEPWTFIVDGQGLVAAKFEAFTTAEEIEEELQKVLQ